MGAPFIYLPNIFHKNNLEAKKSIIFFPLHTHENDYAGNPHSSYKLYLIELKKIIRFFNTISVSLGWREYENENIVNMFKDEGFNVVTMGPRDNNPFFLKNFVKIVGHHEYVSSDSFSSAIFYSLVMKKKVFLYGKPLGKGERINFEGKLNNYNAFYYERYPELLWENFNHKSHFEIGQEELGCDYKLNPKSLREIFGWKIKNIF